MGGGSSKRNPVTPEPIFTTVTVRATTVQTTAANLKASEISCWIDNHQILSISLAFLSGVLLTLVVFAIIYLIRRRSKRSPQNTQEQAPSQTVTEDPEKNVQNEVAYTTVVFRRALAAV